jgi:xanthine dehydrogenase YagS FAD-binding subunit
LEASDVITEKYTILREAAQNVGSTQIRNMGTIAGNICQDPQCMYFRHPHFICYKKGGNQCYAVAGEHRDYYSIFGKGKCVMAHPSDLAPVLVALQARVKAVSHQGERYIPLEDFFAGPNDPRKTTLGRGELINEIVVSVQEDQTYQHFLKHRIRQSFDFALSSVAVVAQISKEICHEIRVVLGGVAPFPYPVHKVGEMMQGERLDAKLIVRAAEASVEEARPLSMNRYKVDVTRALVARALTSAWRKSFSAEGLEISI